MKNSLTEKLGIDYPIFAFTHCRDVVVEVSKAGGIGVLGAVAFSAEQLKQELDWIDTHIGDHPYGVDVIIPQKYEGIGDTNPQELEARLWQMIPAGHQAFVENLLQQHGVPEWPNKDEKPRLIGWTEATALPLVEEALRHPKCRLIANALGTPPRDLIERIQQSGRLIGALCGRVKQAIQHKEAGLDFIVAQGGEGGGHTGDVGSIVLWPQVIKAAAPTPVLAAGGIGSGAQMAAAMALGAAGVWTGSLWLTVEEADAEPAEKAAYLKASSEDTVRSPSYTGKPCRMLKNDWTEAWTAPDAPKPLGMPLQGLVTVDAIRRTKKYAGINETAKVAFHPAGQVIGQINHVETSRQVVTRLLEEFVDATEHLHALLPR